ncbi:MAG TPA: hypothetical protein VHC46_01220 [Thermodesulfobacteriota bacterium]|nr:hypothetical protein [Candidatus Paceibacterota bacterium]HVY54356.1 hypothetical protein [Thermodesulfobacteriota bacterium]
MPGLLKSTLLALFLALFSVSTAAAQSIPGIAEPVTFQISPEFPRPNTSVTVSAQSFSTDLDRATFTWYVEGKVFKKGVGITSISVPVATAAISVSVNVATIDIGTVSNKATIRPGSVDLLWQSDGYAPPFYKGKALETYGSSFKVTAISNLVGSNGKRADPKTLVYSWKKNGMADGAQSGYGKDSYTGTQSSYVRGGDDISVEVSTVSHDAGATRTITITPAAPEVLFYENSPLYGIVYERALAGSMTLAGEEITLRAEPFNISASKMLLNDLSIDWTLNDTTVSDFKDRNEITLRTTGAAGGQSNIGILIQHKTKLLQGGQASLVIFQ